MFFFQYLHKSCKLKESQKVTLVLSVYKIIPEDGAIRVETCRRKRDNTCILLYVHFVGV
jgi:hypothetical protein